MNAPPRSGDDTGAPNAPRVHFSLAPWAALQPPATGASSPSRVSPGLARRPFGACPEPVAERARDVRPGRLPGRSGGMAPKIRYDFLCVPKGSLGCCK